MAKKRLTAEEIAALDASVIEGTPEDGDEHPSEQTPKPAKGKKEPPPAPVPPLDPMAVVAQQLKDLQDEFRDFRRARTEAPPPKPTPPKEPEPKIEWDRLIFEKPEEAVALIKKQAKEEAARELRGEYQQDQKARDFWADFYRENPDLKDDDDLVQLTMNANLRDLQDLPVEKAAKRIAELTRERIVRYSGGKGKGGGGGRAQVEGGGGRLPKPEPEEESTVVTLSDVIRRRREQRRLAGRGTAA